MKKLYTFLFASTIAIGSFSQVSFCENFDSYTNLNVPIAESSKNWNTWGELMTGANPSLDDAFMSNNQSYSGANSLYLNEISTPIPDIVLIFDTLPTYSLGWKNNTAFNIIQSYDSIPGSVASFGSLPSTPYTTGTFEYSHMMYIVPGKTGYFNFQAENIPGTEWALEVNLDATGGIAMSNTGGTSFNCSYPGSGVWFEIKFNIDLTNNIWEVLVDGVSQGVFSNNINKIASLDLYPGVSSEYYVDDVCYSYDTTQISLPNLDMALSNINSIGGLAGQNRDVVVDVINLGLTTVNSFDIDFDYNGSVITENVTGVNIPMLSTYSVSFTNPIMLSGGTVSGTATLSNVNALGPDDVPTNDASSVQITAVVPTPNKLVVGEEATGTWCGWCPRGAVALNFMDQDYHGYFQGIAVHNGDPMTDVDYDGGMVVGGYPSGFVNRGVEIDPSDFELQFMQKISTPISATFNGTAVATGNVINVEMSATATSLITGNWTFACALVEDSVTGTGGTWYQSNSYSGTISLIDVDGTDWMNLPTWVPDVQMIYRHVARGIQPSFNGGALPQSTYNVGDVFTQNFQFTVDPTWDINNMHVVGMLMNNGTIDNAVSLPVSISTSVDNFVSDIDFNIYPNPTTSTTNFFLNLDAEKEVSVSIMSIEGKYIAKGTYGKMIGSHSLTFDVSNLSKGVYVVQAIIGEEIIVKKFIKE
ncbi:MAG: hypothetical protein CMD22_02680 [Flavobacteriales bacterium]|nr:hypothetical protein [Flavobacteriales bacterium]|tara:strand:+ start:3938 stop:6040 length:2103 start_codon:yes stop_codon:yes gene_type:complete